MPLTPLEINTLQMLSEGFKPREILRKGEKLHTLYVRLQRMRVKLDAFTTWHMIAIGLQLDIIHYNTGEIPNEILRDYLDAPRKLPSVGGAVRVDRPVLGNDNPVRVLPGHRVQSGNLDDSSGGGG